MTLKAPWHEALFIAQLHGIAFRAGTMLVNIQANAHEIKREGKDVVTVGDYLSEEFLIQQLKELLPEAAIYSEEAGGALDALLRWVIDPLDGTDNFAGNRDFWGVSVALVENDSVVAGAVNIPAVRLCCALDVRGESYGLSSRLCVRAKKSLKTSNVWTDWIKGPNETTLDTLKKLAEHTRFPQIPVCCTASMMAVATGKIQGYVHPKPAPEDFPAAALIVEKAGGRVTDLAGNPWNARSTSTVATNGTIHDELLAVLNR